MKKLKAGSLQLVTFIVVVIALLLSAFIILIHIHKQFRIKTNHVIETVGLVDKGINYALQKENINTDTVSLSLHEDDYKSLKVHKSFWGVFEKVYTKAKIKNTVLTKMALVGSKRDQKKQTALVLKDNNKPLVLVGKTKVEGKAYLPKRGVKSGNIAGASYYGENYIYGEMALSKSFPKIDKTLLTQIKALCKGVGTNNKEIEYIDLYASKKHVNSFENPLQLISGHISVQSQTKIIIDSSAKLTDVILIAPVIEIRNNVKGVLQAFATDRIGVAEHISLSYPSALVLYRDYVKDESNKPYMIYVGNHSEMNGNIIALGASLPNNYEAQIKINTNALIKGSIYCEQNLELRGTVFGTVFTNNFIIKEANSIYQNHLFNARISSADLESEFVNLLIEQSDKGIAKWLY